MKDLLWVGFGLLWLSVTLALKESSLTFFSPLGIGALYAAGAIIAYFLGSSLKQQYHIKQDETKLLFGIGLHGLALFWLATAALTPGSLPQQVGLFLWMPHIGLFFATLLFIVGIIIPKQYREKIFAKHESISQGVIAVFVVLAMFLMTSPWGIRGIQVLEEQSFGAAENLYLASLVILLIIAYILQRFYEAFKGFSYDALSRGLVFLTVAHYGLLVTQPWSIDWWIFNGAALITLVLLGFRLHRELHTQNEIASSIADWQPCKEKTCQ